MPRPLRRTPDFPSTLESKEESKGHLDINELFSYRHLNFVFNRSFYSDLSRQGPQSNSVLRQPRSKEDSVGVTDEPLLSLVRLAVLRRGAAQMLRVESGRKGNLRGLVGR